MNISSITSNELVIQEYILTFRGMQVVLDSDLAKLYSVKTKRLNEQVKRNIERFPERFRFKLNKNEFSKLVANCDRLEALKHSTTYPYVFTEEGVAMLSAVLNSKTAVYISIRIVDAFVAMRKFTLTHQGLLQRMNSFELKQTKQDKKIEQVFKALESETIPKQGVFFDGQVFDAYLFASDLITSAKRSIRLIDNYIDESVLLLLTKRLPGVFATIYTKRISKTLKLDLERHNSQYPLVNIQLFDQSHDRFLIIDDDTVYHLGASLKDLGKKWFAFSQIDKDAVKIVEKINRLA